MMLLPMGQTTKTTKKIQTKNRRIRSLVLPAVTTGANRTTKKTVATLRKKMMPEKAISVQIRRVTRTNRLQSRIRDNNLTTKKTVATTNSATRSLIRTKVRTAMITGMTIETTIEIPEVAISKKTTATKTPATVIKSLTTNLTAS